MGRTRWPVLVGALLAVLVGVGATRAWTGVQLPVAAALVIDRAFEVQADTLRSNETLSELFGRHGVQGADLLGALRVADGIDPRRVRPGMVFEFRYAVGENRPDRVRTRVSDDAFLTLIRADSGNAWTAEREAVSWTVYTEHVHGSIRVSLDDAIREAVSDSILPPAARSQLVWDLADGVYAWQIDFTRDNYPGDEFTVLFERLVSSEGEIRFGRVLAANMQSRGRDNRAYVLPDDRGRNAYFDETGRSLRRAFKMYPVQFRRISSGFSRSRYHPVLGTYRAHLGTDYAASPGTPIEATGDGVVTRAERWGGYGLIVTVRHAKDIETRYAHMSRIAPGIRPGVRVQQGQWIGNVGATGLASGPHVHYEFLKNGRQVNPRSVDLGDGEPVARARRSEFDSVRTAYERFLTRPAPAAQVD